ncbi:hypothetical protein [Candidatus Epulonipiscium viviparus]|uniref:hypothetical protein n=1 Tax=Candidatus Epulonipiscium viviparus TaxID=420336 RepID=UPI0027380D3F|nr:hypothetical protein [Candidatus Epulopiscium viviparus]
MSEQLKEQKEQKEQKKEQKNEIVVYEELKNSPNFQKSFDLHKKLTLLKIGDKEDNFNKNTLTAINNQIQNHTIIDSKTGILYFRVEGIHNILRTKPGIARNLIYQGNPPQLQAVTSVVVHNDKDYISQPSLMAILDYSDALSGGTKGRYINYVNTSIRLFKTFEYIRHLKYKFLGDMISSRATLKNKKIKSEKITQCQFTNTPFKNKKDVEFAHIDAVAYKPNLATDIRNGVIVLKSIHTEMTKQEINDFNAMYKFCVDNNYDLKWAEKVDW